MEKIEIIIQDKKINIIITNIDLTPLLGLFTALQQKVGLKFVTNIDKMDTQVPKERVSIEAFLNIAKISTRLRRVLEDWKSKTPIPDSTDEVYYLDQITQKSFLLRRNAGEGSLNELIVIMKKMGLPELPKK